MQRIALVVQLPAELAIRDTALDRAVPRSRSIAIMRLRCSSEIRSSGVSAMLLKEWREPSTRSLCWRRTSSCTYATVSGACSLAAL